MPTVRSEITDFTYFLAIAKHQSFRRAGLELGISASALSHALKGLEARLGVRLLNRTARSVVLTAAGAELRDAITAPFDAIAEAVEALNRYRDAPTGRIRLNVPVDAASLLLGPVLPVFVERYPDVELDISISNRMTDVIDGGYDAGIRYGGTVPEDMVAQRLSADMRWIVVGTPAYLDRFGRPSHPDDLAQHRCLRFRLGDESLYRWEFERGEEEIAVAVPGTLTIDDSHLIMAVLRGDAGLMYGPEPLLRAGIEAGELEEVLATGRGTGRASTSIIRAGGSCRPGSAC